MIKVILETIGIIMGFILLIGGIVLGSKGTIVLIEELIINENIGYGVLGLIYGLFISILGYRIVQCIIKD